MSKYPAVGSTKWIFDERSQGTHLREQDAEDFAFSARNELDWLNEHMVEIFSSNQINVTEMFKTPGKLRGKTPWTIRRRNPAEARAPLSDIFSADKRFNASPIRTNGLFKDADAIETHSEAICAVPERPAGRAGNPNFDSGYHGSDDMEVDQALGEPIILEDETAHLADEDVVDQPTQLISDEEATSDQQTTEGSFHTAQETTSGSTITKIRQPLAEMTRQSIGLQVPGGFPAEDTDKHLQLELADAMEILGDHGSNADEGDGLDASGSPSPTSSPLHQVVRKGSLTFASLPAREPLKKSIGARVSRTSHVESKSNVLGRGSYLARYTGGKSLGGARQTEQATDDAMEIDHVEIASGRGDSSIKQLHNKSSTQRLHEKISMLGKTQAPRPTKSIPTFVPAEASYPELFNAGLEANPTGTESEDGDDWISALPARSDALERLHLPNPRSVEVPESGLSQDIFAQPIGTSNLDINQPSALESPRTKLGHIKSASTCAFSALRIEPTIPLQKAISVSNPTIPLLTSTTPAGSPKAKFTIDGPLSASKSKLQSIMRSARGLFTSSAGASAQARMDTMSPTSKPWNQGHVGISGSAPLATSSLPPVYPDLSNISQSNLSNSPPKAYRTRSSTEKEDKKKEREAKDQQRADQDLVKARERERQKMIQQKEQDLAASTKTRKASEAVLPTSTQPIRHSPRRQAVQASKEASREAPQVANASVKVAGAESSKPMGPPSRLVTQPNKPKEMRRPIRPAKEAALKSRPQPVAIRVGTLSSQRIPLTNAALSSSLGDSLSQAKQPAKKASIASTQTTQSGVSFKSSVSSLNSKPKSVLAAERKKELDERDAQRKLDHKREMERKRMAQQEEGRRREEQQRKEAEKQRERERQAALDEGKKFAQKAAIDKRRMEMQKESQQREAQRRENELRPPVMEKVEAAPCQADSKPTSRPLAQEFPRSFNHPPPNPAKPPVKRVFDPDHEEEPARVPRAQPGQTYQANNVKRRKTEDEETLEVPMRPTMAPPIRQSNMRKETKASNHGINPPNAPVPFATQPIKSSALNHTFQHHQQASRPGPPHPIDMAKYTNAKIPFADAPNPPPTAHKTPLASKASLATQPKSSPLFPNGEHIHLEEITTDSDSDDDAAQRAKKARLPAWAQTPNLDQRLRDQERLNPDAVFGPVAPLVMEEIFRDQRKHHRFRSRTSSACWSGQDRLTEEEVRSDHVAREKLSRNGGWTFGL